MGITSCIPRQDANIDDAIKRRGNRCLGHPCTEQDRERSRDLLYSH